MAEAIEEKFYRELIDDLEKGRLVLPTLPEVALRVRQVVDKDDVTVQEITDVVNTDPALSARLIQIANSPLMRGVMQIDSVPVAVMRMGYRMVRDVVTGLVMQQMFQATSEATDKRLHAVWQHSTLVAAISQYLAQKHTTVAPDQALLAGLIHDIGALPILARAEEVDELIEDEQVLDRVVRHLHTEVGARILQEWSFPPEMVAVVRDHEKIERVHNGPSDLLDIVIVANLQSYAGTHHPLAQVDWSQVPAFGRLGLDTEVGVIEMDESSEAIKEVQKSLLS